MIGAVSSDRRGRTDAVLNDVAARLTAEGLRVIGAVQEPCDQADCDMTLRLLPGGEVLKISQRLGPGSSGCRLDAGALELAVAATERALAEGADLIIINKFGKQEAEGRGFRSLIGMAMLQGVPVLTAANGLNRAAFDRFTEGLATDLAAESDTVLAWWRAVAARAA